jgi:signal transduction histidine kinase
MTATDKRADILIADDTPANLALLGGLLRDSGHKVRAVTTGQMAIDAAEAKAPDLILLDINMPGMDGYEVCAQLKSRPHLLSIPVLFISAFTDTDAKVKAFEAGGVDYVTKPFQGAEVTARVETHLGLRRMQKDLEQRHADLQELEHMRDNLTHMIVHDLRSPVTAIGGYLHLIKMGSSAFTEDDRESVQGAIESVQWMTEMIGSLLDVNRLESGEMPLVKSVCDLNDVATDAIHGLGGLAIGRTIIHDKGAGAVVAVCDRDIIRRVVANLVGNALKFTSKSGTITVSARPDGGMTLLEVRDTGFGIDARYLSRVFDKFAQVEARSEHRNFSTGLGLTFCKLAVEAHGGTIAVESKVNVGSRFFFRLPA